MGTTYVLVMLVAGALAGLGGAAQVLGTEGVLTAGVAASFGFDAITVALLGRSTPLGTVLAALLFGALRAGSPLMQSSAGTPIDIVQVIQASIVLLIAAPPLVRRFSALHWAAGIAGSTILAWVLWEPFTDPSRIYYGTDTRAVCLLAGVALAFLWPASRLRPLTERRPRIILEATGAAVPGDESCRITTAPTVTATANNAAPRIGTFAVDQKRVLRTACESAVATAGAAAVPASAWVTWVARPGGTGSWF